MFVTSTFVPTKPFSNVNMSNQKLKVTERVVRQEQKWYRNANSYYTDTYCWYLRAQTEASGTAPVLLARGDVY
jgi:hypothetical protein